MPEKIAPASVESYVHELCADMCSFRESVVYAWFVMEARRWDDTQTTEQLANLTTESVGTQEQNERVYGIVLADAQRRGYTVRANDDRELFVRAIHVWNRTIAVSAYANLTTLQWVVLTALFMADVRAIADQRLPDPVEMVGWSYSAAYGVLRALGVTNPNVARALILEGVSVDVLEDGTDNIASLACAFLSAAGPTVPLEIVST